MVDEFSRGFSCLIRAWPPAHDASYIERRLIYVYHGLCATYTCQIPLRRQVNLTTTRLRCSCEAANHLLRTSSEGETTADLLAKARSTAVSRRLFVLRPGNTCTIEGTNRQLPGNFHSKNKHTMSNVTLYYWYIIIIDRTAIRYLYFSIRTWKPYANSITAIQCTKTS